MVSRVYRHCPLVYADQTKQEKVRKNWKHHFKRGEEVWIVDEPHRKMYGPFEFAHYSMCSAVVLYREPIGRFTARRVYFMKDQIMCQTEAEAKVALGSLAVLDFLDHQHKANSLIEQVEEMLGKKIADTLRKHS
jgi:hypothetical protein